MTRLIKFFSFAVFSLIVVLGVMACSTDFDNPVGSVDPDLAGNFTAGDGVLGELGIRIHDGEIDINLMPGIWKVSYKVNGIWYEVAVYLETERLVLIGIEGDDPNVADDALVSDVTIQKGTTSLSDLADGTLFDVATWSPLDGVGAISVYHDNQNSEGIQEIEEEDAHPEPKPEPVVARAR
jgi:hypothetical protein